MTPRLVYHVPLPAGTLPAGGEGVGREMVLGPRTLVMGILNVTPDSFADGGLRFDPGRAVADGLQMLEQGADIVDVGGESTRPGAEPLDAAEELRRVLPVVERLAARDGALISVDTYKAIVASEAVERGASIVNDVSGLQYDAGLAEAVAASGAALVLMHNRGRSRDMYREASYGDVPAEIAQELTQTMERAMRAGVSREAIILDPGLGFAKRPEHSYAALAALDRLSALDRPILVGPSRKSFLKTALGDVPPEAREWGTAAAVAASVLLGAHIVRVHAVREMADVVRVADRLRAAGALDR
jgi:dihydropteroate synthase